MSTDRPSVFSIAPGLPFLDLLAAGLLAESGGDPLALARYTVLLPTRRACRSLADAFLRLGEGRAALLPRLQPLGDIDDEDLLLEGTGDMLTGARGLELPPAISPSRRLLLLARAIMKVHAGDPDDAVGADQAAWLAHDLARLLDQVQTEQLGFDGLADLVPEDYAGHWQTTLRFLRLLTEHWPGILAEEGAADRAERRNAVLLAQADLWRASPPDGPIVAAGSTGSIPATAALLKTIAGLPEGRIVLPGLDRDLDDESWEALDAAHPQYGLRQLLALLDCPREQVADWPAAVAAMPPPAVAAAAARARLVSEAMRPAATSGAWRRIAGAADSPDGPAGAIRRIDCPGPQEEAGVIALVMREVAETQGKTAALATPDRTLARRAAVELRRWGIDVDDSGGEPLATTPVGSFLRLTARMIAEDFAPVALLAAGKHPLAAGGLSTGAFRSALRLLERAALRGPRPAPGLEGLRRSLDSLDRHRLRRVGEIDPARALVDRLDGLAAPFSALMAESDAPLPDLLRAHMVFAEALAATDEEPGAARLWAGEAGEQAADLVAEALAAADGFPPIRPAAYPEVLEAMMAGRVVRPRFGRHPRLHIWGPLEARLQRVDTIILGGLNEGTWPAEIEADPWMSRPMRQRFGLPPGERRIGLAAHDFSQAFCAEEVVLTRATRVEGTPTVPSRWLLRLDAVLIGLGRFDPDTERHPWAAPDWLSWQRLLDGGVGLIAPVGPPAPCPPVHARPRKLSVTQIETWLRDPYAIYAREVLGLEALPALDEDPGAADYGTLVHHALDRFLREVPAPLPDDALDRLMAIGREVLDFDNAPPAVRAFWWPRFGRIARWLVATERVRGAEVAASRSEIRGVLQIDGPAGPFRLSATADRVDTLAGGGLAIIDYKTGAPPSDKEVEAGFAPQLPLEAAIAAGGGFDGLPAEATIALEYWRLRGGSPPDRDGERKPLRGDPADLAARELDRLRARIADYDHRDTPYTALPDPRRAPRYSDYAHLARVAEWTDPTGEEPA